jgi:dTDP-4-amino-4,6-dideoxygalactose transaminase
MTPIMQVAGRYDIPLIEDAAQAIGAEYPIQQGEEHQYKRAGSMGLAGCFSFFPSKNLGGIGDGGMVVTQDAGFAEKLMLMRNHGAQPKYYHKIVGGNFRLDPLQAAALRVKLPYLDRWHSERSDNSSVYKRLFEKTGLLEGEKVKIPRAVYQGPVDTGTRRSVHIYNQYVLRVERRNELRDWLLANDIGCEIYYPVPLHRQECLGQLAAGCHFPEAEKAADTTIALPIYPELTEEMQGYVVDKIVQFYS